MPPEVPLLYRYILAIMDFLFFHVKLIICSFKFCEELCWDFDGDCPESIDYFCRIAIFFSVLIFPTQEHERLFHFLVSSSISFFKDLKFLPNRSFTSLIRVIFYAICGYCER